jgi:hypothetical protein
MYTVFEDIISIRKRQLREGSTATKRYVCMNVFAYAAVVACPAGAIYMSIPSPLSYGL